MKIGKPAEIQSNDALSRSPRAGSPTNAVGRSGDGAVEKSAAVDAVRLSPASQSLAAEGTGEMPVRSAKVEEVRQAIRDGRFEVDAHAVAEKMITQAAELLETLTRKP